MSGRSGLMGKNPPTHRQTCGTRAGYQAHARAGERACRRCAARQYYEQAQWRIRTGRTTNAHVPYATLVMLLNAVPAEVREQARIELGLTYNHAMAIPPNIEEGSSDDQD